MNFSHFFHVRWQCYPSFPPLNPFYLFIYLFIYIFIFILLMSFLLKSEYCKDTHMYDTLKKTYRVFWWGMVLPLSKNCWLIDTLICFIFLFLIKSVKTSVYSLPDSWFPLSECMLWHHLRCPKLFFCVVKKTFSLLLTNRHKFVI